jgi:protoporphyrinogen oxidase
MKKELGKTAIIGAGLTGLTAACDLCAAGYSVSIFEKDNFAGGLCSCFPTEPGKDPIERFYHHLLTSDFEAINLLDEFDLLDRLEWLPPVNSFISGQKTYRFSSPFDLLRFQPVPPLRRLLMGLHILSARFIRNWQSLSQLTAAAWVKRHAGSKVYQTVWQPLLRAKFGSEAENISAVWLANKMKLRGSSQKKSGGGECLGYPRGSFAVLIDAMINRLRQSGAKIYLKESVTEIKPAELSAAAESSHNKAAGEFIVCSDKRQEKFASVLCTVSPAGFARIMPAQPAEARKQWQQIRYQANLCLKQIASYRHITGQALPTIITRLLQ